MTARTLRKIYGWEKDGVAYLSPFPSSYKGRPANRYTSREIADAYAKSRNCAVEWES